MKKLYVILIAVNCIFTVSAQTVLYKNNRSLAVGELAPKEKIVALFGQPYNIWASEDEAAGGYLEMYEYNQLRISVVDGLLWDFAIDDPDCEVMIHGHYKVKIGDSYLSFVASIPQSEVDIRQLDEDRVKMYFKIKDSDVFSDDSLVLTCKQGKIVLISWDIPV